MKTENESGALSTETVNQPTAETSTVGANTTEAAASPASDNVGRLAELAGKIRDAYATEHQADGMVVDWGKKQLAAGIEMGGYLNEAKILVPAKGFIKWCRANFSDLNQRTLNRYMKIARNATLVSQASGLKEAYEKSSTAETKMDSDASDTPEPHEVGEATLTAETEEPSDFENDFKKINGHLTKAKDILNGYQKLVACDEADAVCDLIDALALWVSDYRKNGNNLFSLPPIEVSLDDDQQPTTPEHKGELVPTE